MIGDAYPSLVVANRRGEILDLPWMAMGVTSGKHVAVPNPKEFIPLPLGSDLFHLPGRHPVGFDRRNGKRRTVREFEGEGLVAVAAFLSPAHTLLYNPAYRAQGGAPRLPMYAYCAVGWTDSGFVVPARRVDPDIRQDHDRYEQADVDAAAERMLARHPDNRLARHLVQNCVLRYGCPAARNFVLERWEMPLPTAPGCNSACFGCISKQPEGGFPVSQERLDFVPTPEEICEIAVPHLREAERAVASFGQGCEGEPLTQPDLLLQAIRLIRRETDRGTINLNTNGSIPGEVERLIDAGLDSVRVSINSFQPHWYDLYYRPKGYTMDDVLETMRVCRRKNAFCSVNYLVAPGITDTESEEQALMHALADVQPGMIQWRNLNIDPEEYVRLIMPGRDEKLLGMGRVMDNVRERFPAVRFGYFNPVVPNRA